MLVEKGHTSACIHAVSDLAASQTFFWPPLFSSSRVDWPLAIGLNHLSRFTEFQVEPSQQSLQKPPNNAKCIEVRMHQKERKTAKNEQFSLKV